MASQSQPEKTAVFDTSSSSRPPSIFEPITREQLAEYRRGLEAAKKEQEKLDQKPSVAAESQPEKVATPPTKSTDPYKTLTPEEGIKLREQMKKRKEMTGGKSAASSSSSSAKTPASSPTTPKSSAFDNASSRRMADQAPRSTGGFRRGLS